MGKTSHHQAAREKPAMELSPQRTEQFRSQITRAAWRYAAQGPLQEKVKSQIYRLGSTDEPPTPKGVGISVKVAMLTIALAVGGTAAWRVFEGRLAALRGDGAARQADGRRPLEAPGAHQRIPGNGGDLPPPIVPSEFGPGGSPEEGSAQDAVEQARVPWAHVLAAAGPPPPFEEVCLDDFPPEQRSVKPDKLRRWLRAQGD